MLNSSRLFNQNNIKDIPNRGGIYFFQDNQKSVIYIGKTKKLKNRIKSYYHKIQKLKSGSSNIPLVHRNLLLNICFFYFKTTRSDLESLLLENDMIKKYMPEYNIKQKDYPQYKFIEISGNSFPYLKIITRPHLNSEWFGPYKDKFFAQDLINFVSDLFKIRTCQQHLPRNKCLRYDLQ
ncbi:MAG: hypothetical protein APR63_13435 [Desulfuromonas sp. SDB]|nr:MAG: hypothetical protein APR63_13435 [Desulfuromonas sp. SDB]